MSLGFFKFFLSFDEPTVANLSHLFQLAFALCLGLFVFQGIEAGLQTLDFLDGLFFVFPVDLFLRYFFFELTELRVYFLQPVF